VAQLVDDDSPGADLVEVAFAGDAAEGELIQGLLEGGGIACILRPAGINGPMLGFGLLPRAAQRVMVRPERAQAARGLLYENLFANEQDAAEGLSDAGDMDASSGKLRNYGLLGGYARAWLFSVGAMAIVLAVFLLVRSI
jgi:putative signal transducing protein